MKKYLPLALQGVALAVAIGWALDVHVPGFNEPIVTVLPPSETRVQVQPLAPQPPPTPPQVVESKVEIRSFKGQVEAARAKQWKQTTDSVVQTFGDLTNITELPNFDNLPSLEDLPDYFTLADLPPIPDLASSGEWQKLPDLKSIEEKLQKLPLLGKDLPSDTVTAPASVTASLQGEAVPQLLGDAEGLLRSSAPRNDGFLNDHVGSATLEDGKVTGTDAEGLLRSSAPRNDEMVTASPQGEAVPAETLVSMAENTMSAIQQAASDLLDVAQNTISQVSEAAQNSISQASESAKEVLNDTAAAVEPSVTHMANAVAAEVGAEVPESTPLAQPVSPAIAEQTPSTPIATEPATEVVAIAPESVPAAVEPPISPKAKAEAEAEEPASVVLKEIRFRGAKYFSNESLQTMVAKFVGIPLQYNDLLDIGFAVENFYKKNNHLARVMLTQQDVTEGVLTLDVIESKLSKITVDQQVSALPSTQAHVLALIEQQHPKDSTFNATQVDRALALANEVPGISVSGALHEGSELGETELILKLYQNHGRQAELVMDNMGSRATGAERLMGNATFTNPTDSGDLISLSSIITRGSEYFRGAYSLPIGRDGWRLGLNASAMDYKVVVGDIGVVGGIGQAFTEGLELIYPIDRSPQTSSTFSLTAEAKQFKNVMEVGTVMTDYDAEVLVAQFSGVDRAFTKTSGVFNYNIQLSHGLIDLHANGMTNAATDQNKINGEFNKLRTNLTFIEPWTPNTDIYLGFTGQLADKNLDSSEKFQLGGANGIRAYPTGEGSGSDGKMLNFELRHRFENGVSLTGFYDWGHVDDLHTPGPANNGNNSYDLKGFGLTAGYTFRNGVSAKATWATRDGDNPNPKIPSGNDQDGSRDRNRFWLQVTIPF